MLYLKWHRDCPHFLLYAPPDDGDDGDKGDTDDSKGGGGGKGDGGDGDKDWKAEAEKWQGLARKHEGEANKGKDAIKKLKEIEDADKSELTRAQEAVTKHQTDLATANLELARIRVALRKGLTETQAKRLVGTTEEELEADADEFLKDIKPTDTNGGRQRQTTPRENMRRGNTGSGEDPEEEMDPRKLAELVHKR